jgi:hypothetical protein
MQVDGRPIILKPAVGVKLDFLTTTHGGGIMVAGKVPFAAQ